METYTKDNITIEYEIVEANDSQYLSVNVSGLKNKKPVNQQFTEKIPDGYNIEENLDYILNEFYLYGVNILTKNVRPILRWATTDNYWIFNVPKTWNSSSYGWTWTITGTNISKSSGDLSIANNFQSLTTVSNGDSSGGASYVTGATPALTTDGPDALVGRVYYDASELNSFISNYWNSRTATIDGSSVTWHPLYWTSYTSLDQKGTKFANGTWNASLFDNNKQWSLYQIPYVPHLVSGGFKDQLDNAAVTSSTNTVHGNTIYSNVGSASYSNTFSSPTSTTVSTSNSRGITSSDTGEASTNMYQGTDFNVSTFGTGDRILYTHINIYRYNHTEVSWTTPTITVSDHSISITQPDTTYARVISYSLDGGRTWETVNFPVGTSSHTVSLTDSQYYGEHSFKAKVNSCSNATITSKPYTIEFYKSYGSATFDSINYPAKAIRQAYKNIYTISESTTAVENVEIKLPAPEDLELLQNGLETETSSFVDSIYASWSAVTNATSYGYALYNSSDVLVSSGTTVNTNITFSALSLDTYTCKVWAIIVSVDGNEASESKQMSTLPAPENLEFVRTGVNEGILSWESDYSDTNLTYYEIFDGNTSLDTTNNLTYSISGISQGTHSYNVQMVYNNTNNQNSNTFNSSLETETATLSKLPEPVLSKTEYYSDVVFKNSEGEDCYLLTDGTFVLVSEYVSGNIKQGISGITFDYPINPGYDLTGVSYAFYNKLGTNAYAYDTDVANQTRTVTVGDVTYNSVGSHKVKVKAVFSADTDYNSGDSNEEQYDINTLDAPTLIWGDANHPSSQIIPTGYTPVEYIESDGRQYINTGYAPSQLANIDLEFMFLGTTTNDWSCLYGVKGSETTSYFAMYINSSELAKPNYSTFNPGSNSNMTVSKDGYSHIKTDKGLVYLNSQLQEGASTSLNNRTTPNCNLYLLAAGTPSGVVNGEIKARIYDCNIYDNTTLVREFIPVVRDSDNIPGLYDLVNNQFYASASGVNFTAGSEITLWDENKIYESRVEWLPVSTVSSSNNYADYYFVEVIGDDTVVGNAVTILQPSNDLSNRVGTWIPDPDPLNGAVKGLIYQLPSQTTVYVVNVRALSFNSWYVGGSEEATLNYTINRLPAPLNAEWDPDTTTLSWSAVQDANTYYIYDSGVLIKTITDGTSYHFQNLEDGLHQFRVTAMKRTFAVN